MRPLIFLFLTLVIMMTSPFLDSSVAKDFEYNKNSLENKEQKSQLLKLLVQTFIGSGDLQKAYEVALKGKNSYPNDPYWYQVLGDICLWTSRTEEAFDFFTKLYEMKKEEKLRKKLIELAISLNRFDKAVELMEKDIKKDKIEDLDRIYYLYYQAGELDKLISLLKEHYSKANDKDSLYQLAVLLYNKGNLEEAHSYANLLISKHIPQPRDIILLANILFAKGKIKESYLLIKSNVNLLNNVKEDDTFFEYYMLLSDLGWGLKDFENSFKASELLYYKGRGRLLDYIRLYDYYFHRGNYEKSFYFAYEGFQKYDVEILLEGAVESLYRDKSFEKIISILNDKETLLIKNPILFSRYVASLYHLRKIAEAKEFMDEFLKTNPNSIAIQELIYFAIDKSEQELALYIRKNFYFLDSNLPQAFALLYYFLGEGDNTLKLLYFLKDSSKSKDIILYSDILDLYGRFDEAYKIRYDLFKKLSEKTFLDEEDLESYLRLGAYYLSSKEYQQLLENFKKDIPIQVYNDLYYSYLLQLQQQPTLEFLLKKHAAELRPWMLLNLALWEDDRDFQSVLLEKYSEILPIRDRVTSFERTGQIDKAMEYAFKGLGKNREDYLLYKQFRDLIVTYRPKLDIKSWLEKRGDSESFINELYFSFPLSTSTHMFIKGKTLNMFKEDENLIINAPGVKDFSLGLYRFLQDGKLSLSLGVLETQKANPKMEIALEKYIKPRTNIKLTISKNASTDDTIFLQYGGMKDSVSIAVTHSLTNRLYFYTAPSYNRYYSSDNKFLGEGFYLYNEISWKLRVGYPDYTFRIYSSHGKYTEKSGEKGKIEKLSPYLNPKILPNSFNEIGIGFLFGWENYESYVRVWRPFLSVQVGLNDRTDFNYSGSLGIGGTLLGQDNISFSFGYLRSYRGGVDEIKTFQIRYVFFF